MGRGLRLVGLLTQLASLQSSLCGGGLRLGQLRAGFFSHQSLCTYLFVEIVNLLGSGQETRLLGVLGIKMHTVQTHGMALRNKNKFTRLQFVTRGQCSV